MSNIQQCPLFRSLSTAVNEGRGWRGAQGFIRGDRCLEPAPFVLAFARKGRRKRGTLQPRCTCVLHLFSRLCRATTNSKWVSHPSYTCRVFVPDVQGRIQVVGQTKNFAEHSKLFFSPLGKFSHFQTDGCRECH